MDNKIRENLPPLLGSDDESLRRDSYDHFYKKRPSDLWMGKVERSEEKDPSKCDHYFEETQEGVKCKKCHMGLIGKELKVKEGHVYFGDQKLL